MILLLHVQRKSIVNAARFGSRAAHSTPSMAMAIVPSNCKRNSGVSRHIAWHGFARTLWFIRGDGDVGLLYAGGPERWFVLAFAGACTLASAYGFLQGAWPFGIVDAI